MWQFLKEYLSAPDTIGAIAPSSRHLAASMTASIDFDKAHHIAEYGAGAGVFPREVATEIFLIFTDCISYFTREKRQPAWLNQLTGRYRVRIPGVLLIVLPVSDEALCTGSVFLKIPLSRFLKIGIIAKVISTCMIAFSGFSDDLCGLRR